MNNIIHLCRDHSIQESITHALFTLGAFVVPLNIWFLATMYAARASTAPFLYAPRSMLSPTSSYYVRFPLVSSAPLLTRGIRRIQLAGSNALVAASLVYGCT